LKKREKIEILKNYLKKGKIFKKGKKLKIIKKMVLRIIDVFNALNAAFIL
jgi:hypothetical protein